VIAGAKNLNMGVNLDAGMSTSTFTQIGDASDTGSDTTTICSRSEATEDKFVNLNQTDDVISNATPIDTFQIKITSTSTVDVKQDKKVQKKKKSKTKNQPTTAASQNEVHLARMLCVVVVVFALCWSPYCVSMLFTIFWEDIFLPRSFHMTTLLIGYFNSSCNPIIYGVLNKRFGKEFKKIFCFWRL
jgi:hypothetical protein